ncbi:ABC transporter substrate-binding protein [Maribellus comscasis]|uniref:Thiamine pyrimidine synthase n=1 Tax=Maribellus comscasis TaxID=2681766 RepID=A0A6I6JQ44_9BACT|nr:ABC transporter substrate-binding protein [Maribellus comscasis]QGY43168.1 ABC transporter substrate-binding protein [Maribellus comscasis]
MDLKTNPNLLLKIILVAFTCSYHVCTAQTDSLTFSPQWHPQAQFAGFYMAQKMGYYKEAGLEVKIIHPGTSETVFNKLEKGEADIVSMMLLSAMTQYKTEQKLVNVAQLSQNSSLLIVAKKEKGIVKPEDLNNKKIGIWKSGFDEVPKAFAKSNNLNVNWVPVLSGINLFLNNGVDAQVVTLYNEYNQLFLSGIDREELSTFYLNDMGFNIPEDGLYCLQATVKQKKEAIEKFIQASFKGWEYARNHKEETLQEVLRLMKEAHLATNKAHQSNMLDQILLLMQAKNNIPSGFLEPETFERANQLLLDDNKITKAIPYESFFVPDLSL